MIRGGLRTRFITDSLRLTVVAALHQLGWFDPTIHDTPQGRRAHQPVRYIAHPAPWNEPIEPNSITINPEGLDDEQRGLGGEVEDSLRFYVDILAENDQVGWHITRDVRDIILGRSSALGRTGPVVDVYDFRMATPAAFTTVGVERAFIDRGLVSTHPWMNHWFMVRVDLSDDYYDEYGDAHVTTTWSPEFDPVWRQLQLAEAET